MAKITCEFVKITPGIAQRFLDAAGRNRKIREMRVSLYASMIKRGDWYLTNQGIAFDETGKLIDGQHRLMAIIKADTPAEMLVVRGLKVGAQLVLDQPAARQIHDQIQLDKGLDVTARTIAVAKQMMTSVTDSDSARLARRDVQLVERFYMKYHHGIAYAMSTFSKEVIKGVTIAPVIAPLARAYYCYPEQHELLNEFADILMTGFTDKKTASAAITLRNWLIRDSGSARKRVSRAETYKKTEIALNAFINHELMMRFPKTDLLEELFPLSSEKKVVRLAA